jgi:hypothetical protein
MTQEDISGQRRIEARPSTRTWAVSVASAAQTICDERTFPERQRQGTVIMPIVTTIAFLTATLPSILVSPAI